MCRKSKTALFVTIHLLQVKAPTQRVSVCVFIYCTISESQKPAVGCCFTIEVGQFFNIISQVSCHSQGLFHLQVCLSEDEEERKSIMRRTKGMRKGWRQVETDDDKADDL